jgi:cytochrome P450
MSANPGLVSVLELVPTEMRTDPHPLYHQLRAQSPVFALTPQLWILTGYHDCHALLRDPRLSVEPRRAADYQEVLAQTARGPLLQELTEKSMLFRDPPDHTRLRRLVQRAFTPRMIDIWRERATEIADGLLAEKLMDGEMDVLADYAWPLPVIVIAEMLGVPATERERFRDWARDMAATLEPVLDDETAQRAEGACHAFVEFLTELIEDRGDAHRDDLLGALVAAHEDGDALEHGELMSNLILLLVAGHETTMNSITNGMLALLNRPSELARLRAQPSIMPQAVEELIRFDGPVHLTHRISTEEIEVAGSVLPAGARVLLILAAANRDPTVFEDPDRLDLTRDGPRHIGFGGGPHYCVGNALARLETEIGISRLVGGLTRPALAGHAPEYRDTLTLRGLKSLPITFSW